MNKKAAELAIPFIAFTILVILFAIIILFSFTPQQVKQCIFPAEVDCVDYKVKSSSQDTISVQLINNMHEDIKITSVEVKDSDCTYGIISPINGTTQWPANQIITINMHCKKLETSGKYAVIDLKIITIQDNYPIRYVGEVRYYQ